MMQLGLFRAGVWLAERLPAPLLYNLAPLLALVLSRLPSAPRNRIRRNLSHVLGKPESDPAVRAAVVTAYRTQIANYVDLFRSRVIQRQEVDALCRPAGGGWGVLEELRAAKQGCVLVSAHYGRYELLNHYLTFQGFGATLIVERLRPPALFDLLRRLRDHPTLHLVPHDGGLRPMLRGLGRGDALAFFTDWDPTGNGVVVDFFGRPARFPSGPALVALHAKVPLLVGLSVPDEPSKTLTVFCGTPLLFEPTEDFDADVQRLTQAVARTLEAQIGAHPGYWVMFHEVWPAC